MIKKLTLLFLTAGPLLAGSSKPIHLESQSAIFNGTALELKGGVSLDSPIGCLKAGEAIIYSVAKDNLNPSKILLKQGIKCLFREGYQLGAPSAELDCKELTGLFVGSDREAVICSKEKLDGYPFEIKSLSMRVAFNPHAKNEIRTISAEKSVSILYRNIEAYGGLALYTAFGQEKLSGSHYGEIALTAALPEAYCTLKSGKDQIQTDALLINTLFKTLLFTNPQGCMQASNEEKIHFSSETMRWDDCKQTLLLQDHVVIEADSFGKLVTDGPLVCVRGAEKNIRLIECQSPAFLSRHDLDADFCYTLNCQGTITIDNENKCMTLLSPKELNGVNRREHQILYEDPHGTVTANEAKMFYTYQEGKLVPDRLVVSGDVQITNRFAPSKELQETYAQYILADQAEVFIAAKEVLLRSSDRVLLFDKINRLELSAPTVKIKRNEATKKESIQGIGDVRFVFIDTEFNKIKERFLLGDSTDEEEVIQ